MLSKYVFFKFYFFIIYLKRGDGGELNPFLVTSMP